jgi:hypothetical protein
MNRIIREKNGLHGVLAAAGILLVALSGIASARTQAVGVRAVQPGPKERVFLSQPQATEDDLIALRAALVEAGAEKINVFVGMGVVGCEVPTGTAIAAVASSHGFSHYYEASLDIGRTMVGAADEAVMRVKRAYDGAYRMATAGPSLAPGSFTDEVIDDAPEDIIRASEQVSLRYGAREAGTLARNTQQNSEFLIGHVVSIMVFPESDGGTEDWTDDELSDAILGGAQGCIAFQSSFHYLPMSFTFVPHRRVPTQFEPIQHNMGTDGGTWIPEAVANLGYEEGNTQLSVHALNEDNRRRYGSDWAFTTFVADSRNEPGHIFSGSTGGAGYTAYANLGGPYMVLPFPAGANDPNDLGEVELYSRIFQHEMGHVFWTLDEYPGYQGPCTERSGYLNYENGNKVSLHPVTGEPGGCNPLEDCIMWNPRIEARPWCWFSKGFMGVIDANENDVPDVFDRPPTGEYEGGARDTIETQDYTVRFKAISQAVPNRNERQLNAISYAAPLRRASLSVNGAGAARITPVDGRWDEEEEDLQVNLTGLGAGRTVLGITVMNEFGRQSLPIEKEVYFIGVTYTQFQFSQEQGVGGDPGAIRIRWKTVGETFGAVFEVHRIDPSTGEDVIVATDVPVVETSGAFNTYEAVDPDVVQGHEYSYYVEGYFQIAGRDFNPKSQAFTQIAMVPIAAGSVSNFAPNPFRESTVVSVNVPKSYAQSDGPTSGPRLEVPTEVTVEVFDVAGRKIRDIYKGSFYGRVETFRWDGTNDRRERVPSGVYFVRTLAGSVQEVKKVVVIR